MAVNLHASHYRFGIEELLEATHGWHAALDTNPAQGVIANDTTFLLRFTVQETGGTAAGNTDQQFQCRKNLGVWQNITTTSSIVKAVVSVAFTNAQNCTKRLTGTGTFEASGAGCTEDGLSGGAPNDIAASGNSETECALQIVGADVAGGDSIEFRLTSPDFPITNDVVPTLLVAGATIVEADGSSAGVASDSVVGRSVFAGVTASIGLAASTVVGVALWAAVTASTGLADPLAVSASIASSAGDSAGTSTVAADGVDAGGSTAESAGAATASGVSGAVAQSDGTAAGAASDSVVSGATAGSDAASDGAASSSVASAAVVGADGEVTVDSTAAPLGIVLVGSGLARRITDAFYIDL